MSEREKIKEGIADKVSRTFKSLKSRFKTGKDVEPTSKVINDEKVDQSNMTLPTAPPRSKKKYKQEIKGKDQQQNRNIEEDGKKITSSVDGKEDILENNIVNSFTNTAENKHSQEIEQEPKTSLIHETFLKSEVPETESVIDNKDFENKLSENNTSLGGLSRCDIKDTDKSVRSNNKEENISIENASEQNKNNFTSTETLTTTPEGSCKDKIIQEDERKITDEAMDSFRRIYEEIEEIENRVKEFEGVTSDSDEYYYLDEALMNCLIKLDNIPTRNNDFLRNERRSGIKCTQRITRMLDKKIKENQEKAGVTKN